MELEGLEKLLPTTRRKRGLINFGGDVLNFLFGTATSAELQTLHQAVEVVKKQQTTITHSIEHQLTYTKEIDENVRQNTRDISLLARILKLQVNNIAKLNATVEELETNAISQIEHMANASQTVRELEFFSLQLEQEFIKIRQGLDVTSTGKLSAGLLPPHNLSLILQQVALRLPTDVSLLTGTNVEDMFVYYETAKVQAYATPTEIRLVIRLPLRGTDRVMNLYKTEPLPVYEPLLKRHVQILPETMYMVVSESRQYYSLLTAADIQNCQQGSFTVCESEFPLYHKRTPSCSGALYFGKHELAHEHCNKIILRKNFKPVWIHYKGTPSFWIYSLPMSMKITKTCRSNGTVSGTDMNIESAGILHVEENCQVFSESFLLLSTANGYTNITLTAGQVVTPELPELLTEEETQVLVSHQDQADGTLDALDALMARSSTAGRQHEISLRDLLTDIQHSQYEKHHYNWVVSVVIIISVILIIYVTSKCWRQPLLEFASRCMRRRTRVPVREPVPKLRDARTCALSMIDEDCEMEVKSIMDADARTSEVGPTGSEMRTTRLDEPMATATVGTEAGPAATSPKSLGVRYSQPGRYQP